MTAPRFTMNGGIVQSSSQRHQATQTAHQRDHADWREAVADGSTILGLAEWLAFRDEHNAGEWPAREEAGQ